ncbi:Ig-like domain-containing protein [Microbacterium sp. NPDC008134]|uniref:Ig-like domain-containing protein n=1 Tax=Microbacterium sp. NPDC008134 TaxID=3364183 RepID=UPI0036E151D2
MLGILVLVGAGFGVVSLTQGPRITEVQVDPAHAIDASGSRLILTTNQSLAAIDPAQVTVEPSVPFTVDAAGRGVGIRFTVPLDDETTYTVTVADAVGASGGPKNDLTTSFTTPSSNIFLLNRSDNEDKIFQTDLTGENGVPVFAADKINDFRATSSQLVVTVEEDDGSHIIVMDHDGGNQRELPLPGEGYVGSIQVSERGGLVGYSYSDRELSDTEGRASVLVTQSLNDRDSEPQVIEVGGAEASIFAWQFVPDSAAVLFIDFDGALSLVDRSSDAGVQSLGLAANIQGISRGTYTAIVERLDGSVVELNLADGSEQPLAASDPDYGIASTITPFPGGTLRHVVQRNELGIPTGQAVVRVDDDGTATPLIEVASTDSILQACASPSGQYAAVVVAPNMTDNPYDEMLLPLPKTMETHLIDLRTGDAMPVLTGFDASWCQTAPRF